MQRRANNRVWTAEDTERLRRHIEQGGSVARASVIFRRSEQAVRSHAGSNGWKFPTSANCAGAPAARSVPCRRSSEPSRVPAAFEERRGGHAAPWPFFELLMGRLCESLRLSNPTHHAPASGLADLFPFGFGLVVVPVLLNHADFAIGFEAGLLHLGKILQALLPQVAASSSSVMSSRRMFLLFSLPSLISGTGLAASSRSKTLKR